MDTALIVSTGWATLLEETETTGTEFGPVGSGRFAVSYQGVPTGTTINAQHKIDNEWIETGDSISSADLVQDADGTYSGSWTYRLRHGDRYRFVASAAGAVVKAALILKASGF